MVVEQTRGMEHTAHHRDRPTLDAGLAHIRAAPADEGRLELIVRRPAVDGREVLDVGELDPAHGLVGDTWAVRGSRRTDDGTAHPDMQVTLMGARVVALLAGGEDRWPLAGDQLYVDLDLSEANLPAGTRLALGTAVVEVTDQPHTGCAKFRQRFGAEAHRFVNSDEGRALRLRGLNTRVVRAGTITRGDAVVRLPRP